MRTQASRRLGRVLCLVPVAGLAAGLMAGTSAIAQEAKKGGTLNVAIETDFEGFDAVESGAAGQTDQTVIRTVMEPLLDWNFESNQPEPLLATEWSVNDDQTVWTLKLREGVKMHDGSDFTAEDVAHHYNRILDPANKSRSRTYISAIERVEPVDDYTVAFHLKHPWSAILPYLATYGYSGPIPSSDQVEAGVQQREPVGTGPYRLVDWRPGDRLIVEKFADYWNADEINLDRIEFRVLPENQTRYASLQSGEVDVIWTDRGPTIVDAQNRDDIVTLMAEGGGGATINLNGNEGKKLANDTLRHALAHAWNQEAVTKISWQDTRPNIEHPFGNVDCGDVRYRAFDLDKAKELLAQYQEETGEGDVSLVMIHTATPRGRELGEIYQQTAKAAGITLELVPVDQTTLVKRVYGGDYDISGWRIGDAADLGPQIFSYTQPDSSYNLTAFDNPELTELGQKMRVATSLEERQRMQCEMAALMNDEARILYRGGGRYYAFTRPSVHNVPKPYGGAVDVTRAWIEE
ncbi:ABC transporter substrate-binding protein [Pseudooceanicola sp. LIPI14-2-Ac024]|uniref:ABC transporter substrate-binding protein n=1 Tax=Pseudooceanicola sp. LIPI14-2-Ac024 TaxID=3344875 RepID=UPI0035D06A42